MLLRSGKTVKVIKDINPEELGDVPENFLDVTEEYSQLKFENSKLKNNISMMESEIDESLNELKRRVISLEAENDKLKITVGICDNLKVSNNELKAELLEAERKIKQDDSLKGEMIKQIDLLNEEIASKNEIISLLREQVSVQNNAQHRHGPTLYSEACTRNFVLASKTARPATKSSVNFKSKNKFESLANLPNQTVEEPRVESVSDEVSPQRIKPTAGDRPKCKVVEINKSQILKTQSLNRPKILILADSHGRHLYQKIMGSKDDVGDVCCIFKPNAKLAEVVQEVKVLTQDFTKNDVAIIIGGTNNRIINEEDKIINTMRETVDHLTHTNVVVAGIPIQHQRPEVCDSVDYINFEWEHIAARRTHVNFLPINELPRHYYTRNGLHFNKRGKVTIAQQIVILLDTCRGEDKLQVEANSMAQATDCAVPQTSVDSPSRKTLAANSDWINADCSTLGGATDVEKSFETQRPENDFSVDSSADEFPGFSTPSLSLRDDMCRVVNNLECITPCKGQDNKLDVGRPSINSSTPMFIRPSVFLPVN